MNIDVVLAKRIWNDVFGVDNEMVLDCYGTYIRKADYGDHEKKRQGSKGKLFFMVGASIASVPVCLSHAQPRPIS